MAAKKKDVHSLTAPVATKKELVAGKGVPSSASETCPANGALPRAPN